MGSTTFEMDDRYNFNVKRYARNLVFHAVSNGELERPSTCERCEQEHDEVQAHHTNYGDPLNVVWVCPPCHARIHANKQDPLNPINHEQTIIDFRKNIHTYAKIEVSIPVNNYIIIKDRAERLGLRVEDEITRTIIRSSPYVETNLGITNDDTRKDHVERVSSLVQNETELPRQKLSRLRKVWSERDHDLSGVERFCAISSRYGTDPD